MEQALTLASEHGVIRPRDLAAHGISPAHLRRLVRDGIVYKVGRGLYTLAGYDVSEHHSLVAAVRAQSNGVVCLFSALNFHGLGTQLPHQVWLAVPYGARISNINSVPMRVVSLRPAVYTAGIEVHHLEGIGVPIYGIAKTIADCFKFRNKIGLDVAIESLRDALRERRCSREDIRHYARINRVESIMRPYVEALSA